MKVPRGGTLLSAARRENFSLYCPHIWGHTKLELPPDIQNLMPRAMTATAGCQVCVRVVYGSYCRGV